jgi:hypothetical protein
MENVRVNGVLLTELEWVLIKYEDIGDTNELRDVDALKARQASAGLVSRHRLQRQINALEAMASAAGKAHAIPARPASLSPENRVRNSQQ